MKRFSENSKKVAEAVFFSFFKKFKLGGGGGSERETFDSFKASVKSSEERFFEQDFAQQYFREVTNETVVNAWLKCVNGREDVNRI